VPGLRGGDIGIRRTFTMNERGLPKNVHLLTLRDTGDKSFLVRLAHLFQVRAAKQARSPNVLQQMGWQCQQSW
jgi:hypothetical protein